MTRLRAWWRWLALWFTNQAALVAQNRELVEEVTTVRADYEQAYLAMDALHNEDKARMTATIARLDRECEDWQKRVADAEERVQAERVLGNRAWQKVARLNQQIGQRERAEHASAAVGD